jgi:CheY-like chemotaxis protein
MVRSGMTIHTDSKLNRTILEQVVATLRQPLRILHVDDTEAVLKLQQLYLRRHQKIGFEYIGVLDSVSALRTISAWRPDLILSDISRPCMDGYTFAAALKSRPDTSLIPVAFLTAKSGQHERDRAVAVGAAAFFTKPGFLHLTKIHQLAAQRRIETLLEPLPVYQQLALSRALFVLPALDNVLRIELKRRLSAWV